MLRAVWAICRHDLLRMAREKSMLVFGLALPVVIITLVGLTFGGVGSLDIGVQDLDGSPRSSALVDRLEGLDGVTVRRYDDVDSMRRDVRITTLQAALIVPEGYGERVDEGSAQVDVLLDVDEEAFSALATIDAAVTQEGVREGAVNLVAADGARPRPAGSSTPRSGICSPSRWSTGAGWVETCPGGRSPTPRRPTSCCSSSSTPSP